MTDITVDTVDFIQRRESSAVKQALAAVTALHDAVALKQEIALPVLPETRQAIAELEDVIGSLKLKLLRSSFSGSRGLRVCFRCRRHSHRCRCCSARLD
jgi:hypothetical protein